MIAHSMPSGLYFLKKFREHFHVLANAEESCLGIVFVQLIQNPRRDFRARTVVEGQIHLVPVVWKVPYKTREHPADEFWRVDLHFFSID